MTDRIIHISDIPAIMENAKEAAYQAGMYLLQKIGHTKIELQKSSHDDLLDVDLEAERILLTNLRNATPALGFLSEEAGYEGNKDQYWIIDPLDGSANFQHKNPTFAVAIALSIDHITYGAVIHLPTSNETFTAIRGQGAFLNGTPIAVSHTTNLQEAIAHVGDFTKDDDPLTAKEGLQDFSKLVTKARRIRMIGTAATDLAYVACGRADILINHAIEPWDVEAGKLLLVEAGGKATTILRTTSKPLSIYSNSAIHQTVEELLIVRNEPSIETWC